MRLFQHYISLPSLLFTPIVKICTLDIDVNTTFTYVY